MDTQSVLNILGGVGAIITDSHIVYTSGKHGSAYINKDALFPHTNLTSKICRELARQFMGDHVDVVIAPAIGGVILSQWTAHHLGTMNFLGHEALSTYAERDALGHFVITRGYDKLLKGKNVLVVEDVLNTGGSAKQVVEAVCSHGGNVIGLGVLCNRGGILPGDVGDVRKLVALVNITMDVWDEADCPLCAKGVPINTDVGKGREYLANKADK